MILRYFAKLSAMLTLLFLSSTALSAATLINLDKITHTISVEYPEGKIETMEVAPGGAPIPVCDGCFLVMKDKFIEFEVLEGENVAIKDGVFIRMPKK